MAEVTVTIKSDISDVEKDVTKLSRELRDAKLAFKELEKGTEEYAKKKADIDNLTKALNTSKDALQDLRAQTKKTTEGFAEAKEKMGDLKEAATTLQGSGIERLKNSFGLFKEGLETANFEKAKTGFKGLGAAMKAVPIFLIVEGIMKLIESFDELKESGGIIGKVFSAIGDAIDFCSDKLEEFGDWISGVDTDAKRLAENQIEAAKKTQEAVGERYDYEIKKANAAGQNTAILEISKVRAVRESIDKQIEALEELDRIKDGLSGKEEKQLAELKKSRAKSIDEETILRTKQYSDLVKSILESNKKAAELAKKAEEEAQKRRDNKLKNEQALADAEYDIWKANHEREKKAEEEAIEQSKKDADELFKDLSDKQDQQDAKNKEKKKKDADDAKAAKKEAMDTEFAIETASIQSLQGLSDTYFSIKQANLKHMSAEEEATAKKQFQINKALSIAATVVSGYQGAVAALATPRLTPFGYALNVANAIAIGVATAANVAKISATQFNTSGFASSVKPEAPKSSGGASGSGGSGNPAAQPIPQNKQDSTQFDANGNKTGNTTKVVVLASDIKDVSRQVARVEQQSKF